jgi:hypothetical protein
MTFRRKPQEPRRLTGARVTLKAEHRDQVTGKVHGHEWEITGWFKWDGSSAETRQWQLSEAVKSLQGTCLPDRIAWAENLAAYVAANTPYGWSDGDPDCVMIEVVRHKEGLLARWEA